MKKSYRLKPGTKHFVPKGKAQILYIGGDVIELEDNNAVGIMDKLIPIDETADELGQRLQEDADAGFSGEKTEVSKLQRLHISGDEYKVVHSDTGEALHEGHISLDDANLLMGGGELPDPNAEPEPEAEEESEEDEDNNYSVKDNEDGTFSILDSEGEVVKKDLSSEEVTTMIEKIKEDPDYDPFLDGVPED